MATNAMKIWGTTAVFNGSSVGEVRTVGRGKRKREIIEVFSCSSPGEAVEKLSSGINEGQITLGCYYDGDVVGAYKTLDTAYAAGTSGTLTLTFGNGSTISATAIIVELDTPGGEAKGGVAEFDVTFDISGAWTMTGA